MNIPFTNPDKKTAFEIIEQFFVGIGKSGFITDSGEWHELQTLFKTQFNREYEKITASLKNAEAQKSFTKLADEAFHWRGDINNGFNPNISYRIQQVRVRKDQNLENKKEIFRGLATRLATLLALASYGLTSPYGLALTTEPNYNKLLEDTIKTFANNLKGIGLDTSPLRKRFERIHAIMQRRVQLAKKEPIVDHALRVSKKYAQMEAFIARAGNYF